MGTVTKKRKASHDGKYHPLNLLRNWIHQGLSYMDTGELVFRLFIELIETIIIYWGIIKLNLNIPEYIQILLALLMAHTFNWVINGNFWALYLFAFPHAKNQGEQATVKYLAAMAERLKRSGCVGGLALYGSVTRGAWHTKSDFDIRIVRKRGLLNLLCANLAVMRERFIALIEKQPADLFMADDVDSLRKMRADEKPIFLIKRMAGLDIEYPGNDETTIIMMARQTKTD